MAKYNEVKSGEWVQPVMKGYKMACCDCGLVHTINFKIVHNGKKVRLQAFRDNRKTAAKRREMKKKNIIK